MQGTTPWWVTVVETSVFARRAAKFVSADDGDELIAFLAANPTPGGLIEGTGGMRKVRFAAGEKGKSGGVRVIHYLLPHDGRLYALLIYGKVEQADLSPDRRQAMAAMAAALKQVTGRRR